jgi:hypothetical protein
MMRAPVVGTPAAPTAYELWQPSYTLCLRFNGLWLSVHKRLQA